MIIIFYLLLKKIYNNKQMKKGSIDFKITHFNFIVKPKEIMFINKKANTYRLQFNKGTMIVMIGPQILKKF